jgi:ammonium transporter, Amt family
MSPGVTSEFGLFAASLFLMPLSIAGLALTNAGLGRSRSAAHAMTSSLCVIAMAAWIYFVCGFRISGPFGHAYYGIFTKSTFFFMGIPPADLDTATFGMFGAVLCSLIPLGAGADRWRISAACVSTVVLAGLVYPIFGRVASTGFLAGLGSNLGLGNGFFDAGGSGFIHVTGGLTALGVSWLLGPRHGKYTHSAVPTAIPAHNAVLVLFGCLLAWVGWLGLNSAGALLSRWNDPGSSILAAVNTTFSAAAAALISAVITRGRFRKPDASLIANGWMAGLVASSAGCATLKPATAVLTGLVAGALVVFSVEMLEFKLKVDDPCGSVSVHAVCGIWGLLAAGIFSDLAGQFMAQLVGVATLLGLIFPLTYLLNWLLRRFIAYRVSVDGERQGLDLHELGADAYPEFVVHTDEFIQR